MANLIWLPILGFFAIAAYLYRKDIKDKRAKAADFYKPILFLLVLLFANLLSNGIHNFFFSENSKLEQYNDVRVKVDLCKMDTFLKTDFVLFKNWKSFFKAAPSNCTAAYQPKQIQENGFVNKRIIVKDKKISFEEDSYSNGNRFVDISYDYLSSTSNYAMYRLNENGKRLSCNEMIMTREQCMDTLKAFHR